MGKFLTLYALAFGIIDFRRRLALKSSQFQRKALGRGYLCWFGSRALGGRWKKSGLWKFPGFDGIGVCRQTF
jgi:hypothetical protein